MSFSAGVISSIFTFILLFSVVLCGQAGSKPASQPEAAKANTKTKITLSEVEVSVVDPESGKSTNTQKVSPGKKLSSTLNVAENQRLILKFSVQDSNGKKVKADQAFVRLTQSKFDVEAVFIGEADADGYKVDIDTVKKAGDFKRLNGAYELRVDVGDVGFQNAVSALLGTVQLNFASGVNELPDPLARYQPRPEIKHMFREPEKRPPAVVSTAFSFAVLAPAALLFMLWLKVRINFNNFDFHPASLVFYGSLGGIFFLYYTFWLYLDMFSTLKYLSGLGVIALVSGNVMFSRMYRNRTGKESKD